MPPLAGIDKLRADEKAKDDQITALMDKSVTENRSLTADEMKTMTDLDTEVRSIGEAIKVAEAREARETERNKPPESRGVRSPAPGEAPGVHTEKRRHSVNRLIRIEAGLEERNGIEWECHLESKKKAIAAGRTVRGTMMPIGNDAETRRMMGLGQLERRDVTTTTVSNTIFQRSDGFIDLLRPNTVIEQMGATWLTGVQGNFAMIRQNGTNTLQWVTEGNSATPTNFGFDRVPFSPKLGVATQITTREAIMQSSVDLDTLTEEDFAKIIGLGIDAAVINGPGGAAPLGLLNNPAVPTYLVRADTGNGGAFTYADAVNMETAVAKANALRGRMCYLTTPGMRGSLKQQFVGTAGYPLFIFGKGSQADVGEINGYAAYVTPLVPSTLTKGTAVGTCSAVIYGMFNDVVVVIYDSGGLDIVVDPYSLKRSGSIETTTYLAMDTNIRQSGSFIACQDAIPQY